ncbi:MAG: FAD-binding domain-containing protein, partial [Pseudomonadota bacterium]
MHRPQPTRQSGLLRLSRFVQNAGRNYARDRNSDFGIEERSNVSLLSGHIRHRLLLETEVLDAVLARFSPSTADKFIQEVFWRGYFKGWLEQHPSVWSSYREEVIRLVDNIEANDELAQRYRLATQAQTGIICFDTWARELIETGYLHNHSRMWFASIWIFTLQLPWQLGADFFYRHLVDGDPASNTLSWRWVGGLHTKGKTYLARPSNIEKFTGNRFAPYGQLAEAAPPLSEPTLHPRQAIRQAGTEPPTNKVALLITEEDGRPEDLFSDLKPIAGISLLANLDRSPLPIGDQAAAFVHAAVSDAAKRTSEHFAISIDAPLDVSDWGTKLAEFAQQEGAST